MRTMKFSKFLFFVFIGIFLYGCGSGGGGDGDVSGTPSNFRIEGHQLYLVNYSCALSCNDNLQCITANCVRPIKDTNVCVGDVIGYDVYIYNDNRNTKAFLYELYKNGNLVEGPYYRQIVWNTPEKKKDHFLGTYNLVVSIPGTYEVRAWLEDKTGRESSIYKFTIITGNCTH